MENLRVLEGSEVFSGVCNTVIAGSNPAVTSLKMTTSVYDVVFLLYNLQIKYIVNLCNIRNICCTHFIIF